MREAGCCSLVSDAMADANGSSTALGGIDIKRENGARPSQRSDDTHGLRAFDDDRILLSQLRQV